MDKALQLLGIARKGGRLEAGEEPSELLARSGKARLVIAARDAAAGTLRRIQNHLTGTKQLFVQVPYTKEELGHAVGKSACAVCTLTDYALALGFVRSLNERDPALETELARRAERIKRRKAKAKK